MKELPKKLKMLFSLMLLGAIYGGAIGVILALLTGNNVWTLAISVAVAVTGTVAMAVVWAVAVDWDWVSAGVVVGAGTVAAAAIFVVVGGTTGARTSMFAYLHASFYASIYASQFCMGLLRGLAKRNKTTPKALIEDHIAWIFSLPMAIFSLLFVSDFSVKSKQKSKIKQRALDMSLIIAFSQGLAESFPKEWNEWQHWIRDMMDSRTRMQSKGMNHRLVSLITFYRLTRFVWHIGIDKVFILATRRATR